eukprot:CAMPEP_0195522660 /NCGR_PEP_ID=MMETSP0794_2-20130614/21031_1 /TAXON_ID=515487 /ORGANISM="Stephanopyxis turris, Strain CCMP 815" /LENGTH=189 /DNA_ID=CAMNT_0040652463 /DNA_START=214 /DNA_END=783 /DNA_ORIENTATION=-
MTNIITKRSINSTCFLSNNETNVATTSGQENGVEASIMPKYNENHGITVTPAVEELFKDILKLDKKELPIVGMMLMKGCNISNDEMMMVYDRRTGITQGGIGGGGASAEAVEEEVVEEKTAFDLKLNGFDSKSKIKVIKEVRAITSLGLKESKELVEGAPKVIKKGIKKEEAEELKAKLEAIGGVVEIV